MGDCTVTIEDLKEVVRLFCAERDWDRFHTPKDIAIGISIEASELLERFIFKNNKEVAELLATAKGRQEVGDELADVLYFVLRFAQMYNFDLSDELSQKIDSNAKKYPVEKARGSNRKYTEL